MLLPQFAEMNEDDDGASLEPLRSVVNTAEKEQREAYVNLFQKFKDALHNKIQMDVANEVADTPNTYWWRWVSGWFRRVAREVYFEIGLACSSILDRQLMPPPSFNYSLSQK